MGVARLAGFDLRSFGAALTVGLALLTPPAISALMGWLAYGETLTPLDWLGAAAIAGALVRVRLRPAPHATT